MPTMAIPPPMSSRALANPQSAAVIQRHTNPHRYIASSTVATSPARRASPLCGQTVAVEGRMRTSINFDLEDRRIAFAGAQKRFLAGEAGAITRALAQIPHSETAADTAGLGTAVLHAMASWREANSMMSKPSVVS